MNFNILINICVSTVSYLNKLMARFQAIPLRFKLLETKYSLILFLFFMIALTIFVLNGTSTGDTYYYFSLSVSTLLLLFLIPVMMITLLEFTPKASTLTKNYRPEIINNTIIYNEFNSSRTTQSANNNNSQHSTLDDNQVLNQSFKKLLDSLSKSEFYDNKKKCFDLMDYKLTPLLSMQILLLYFENNYATFETGKKKIREDIYRIFNKNFNGHKMTSKNWNPILNELNYNNEERFVLEKPIHQDKVLFYNDLSKKLIKL